MLTKKLEKVTQDALELPVKERARLAHVLIHSIDDAPEEDSDAAWDIELQRRVDEIREGKIKGIPAAEVFARALLHNGCSQPVDLGDIECKQH